MAYPKAMYKQTSSGMKEEIVMSLKEERDYLETGWHDHPEYARLFPEVKKERKKRTTRDKK